MDYVIKSWRGGISDEDNRGIQGAYKFGYAIDIHKRKDSLSSKQAMATILTSGSLGTTLTSHFNFFVPASDGTTYCFGAQGSIFALSGDGTWTFVYNDENGKIRGAAEWELDDGVNYLYWATATSLARKRLPGSETSITPDTSAPSLVWEQRWTDVTADYKTTLNSREWHTMKQASGQLAIANGESLGSVEFDGDFNAAVLNIRPGNLIKTIEERDDYTILGSGKEDGSEEGHIWSWLTTATNYIQKKRIPIKGVNAIIQTEFNLLQGGDDGELFLSDFVTPIPLAKVTGGGSVFPGGVSIEDDLAIFGFSGSSATYPGIWSYGRRMKNRPTVLGYDYRLASAVAGSTISTVAAVLATNGVTLVSWGSTESDSSIYGVDQVSSTTKATAVYEGLEFDAGSPQIKKFFDSAKVVMAPLPSGSLISLKYKIDNETSWRYAVTGDNATTYSVADSTEAEFKITDDGAILEIGTELNPTLNLSPEILSISVIFEPEQEHA